MPREFDLQTHVDKGINPPREEQLAIVGDGQAYNSVLVGLEGKKNLVSGE
jgi:hypothetical protein